MHVECYIIYFFKIQTQFPVHIMISLVKITPKLLLDLLMTSNLHYLFVRGPQQVL